jgi:hypothetical protein
MSEDSNNPPQDEAAAHEDGVDLGRRKLVYVAPVILTQRLFSAAAGCGKVNPTTQACYLVSLGS